MNTQYGALEDDTTNVELMPVKGLPPITTQALQVRQEQPLSVVPLTAEQAKVNAIADLTHKAYERASQLQLTPEEQKALQADFPDEAFKPGAAGKTDLIYIEHAFLRDRFLQVFGPGAWSLVARSRWAEDFEYYKDNKLKQGTRIYVEAMLMVRGCFVAEAVGDMTYYKGNDSQNYADACEGAKTAAFRRCAKEFGVGLQVWKKDWCEGWWQRKRSGSRPVTGFPATAKQSTPAESKPTPEKPRCGGPKAREWMIEKLYARPGEPGHKLVTEYFRAIGQILPNEELAELPFRFVAVTAGELRELGARLAAFENGEPAEKAFEPHDDTLPTPSPTQEATPAPPSLTGVASTGDEAWRAFPTPWGSKAGVPLGKLEKKFLFGLWRNVKVETEYNGKPKKPETIAKDELFRKMLNEAGAHYGFQVTD